MSQENVETVKQAIAEVNARDIDGYLARCTEDIELLTPMGPIGGTYEGPDAIRRFFADIEDTAPDFRLDLERVEAIDEDRVLAFVHLTASGRTTGIPHRLTPRTSTTSSTARSAASVSSSTAKRLSKPPGFASRAHRAFGSRDNEQRVDLPT